MNFQVTSPPLTDGFAPLCSGAPYKVKGVRLGAFSLTLRLLLGVSFPAIGSPITDVVAVVANGKMKQGNYDYDNI